MPDFLFSPVAQMVWEIVFIFGIKVCMGTAEPFKISFFYSQYAENGWFCNFDYFLDLWLNKWFTGIKDCMGTAKHIIPIF